MGLFDLFKKEKKEYVISQEPDTPLSFGMKISWLVIKEKDPKNVMDQLHCKDAKVCNWDSAFKLMREQKEVFVTPSFQGYVLVINYDLPLHNKKVLEELAMKFEEVQFFSSYRIVDAYCWVKYVNQTLIRSFYYVGDQGEILWSEGELTKEEQEIGLNASSFDLEEYDDDIIYPDEDVVIELAGKWGVHPFLEEYEDTKSTGFLCKLES